MKYLSIFALLLICQLGLNAQKVKESSVPEVVKNNFTRVVPNTTVTEWEMEDGNYEASYKQNDAVNSIIFTSDGKIVCYKYNIASSELPEAVRNYITTNLAGKKIGEINRMKTVSGSVSYDVTAGDSDYFFDGVGDFLRIEKETNTGEK